LSWELAATCKQTVFITCLLNKRTNTDYMSHYVGGDDTEWQVTRQWEGLGSSVTPVIKCSLQSNHRARL
jgi:hypothetical protein